MTETVIGIHQTAQLAVTRHVETLGTGCLGLLEVQGVCTKISHFIPTSMCLCVKRMIVLYLVSGIDHHPPGLRPPAYPVPTHQHLDNTGCSGMSVRYRVIIPA